YLCAMGTGFRAGELASLVPESFDLDAEPPTATVAAAYTKNGKLAVQPLPPEVVEALRGYLAGRLAGGPVWPGSWADGDAAAMLRMAREAAGVPYVVEGPDGPLYADFHALRHSFIARLDRSGATLREAMQLARHSDPKLTMAVYGRAQLHDLGEAVRRLPALLNGPDTARARQVVQATGTGLVCTGFAQTTDTRRDSQRPVEANKDGEGGNTTGLNPLTGEGVEASCDPVSPGEVSIPDRSRTCNLRLRRPTLWTDPFGLGEAKNP